MSRDEKMQRVINNINLRHEQLFKQVVQQIQDIIVAGELRPGDRLPSERDLAQQLTVSRTVIREALKLLEDRGLVSINVGDGTYVSEIPPNAISKPISLYIQQQRTSFAHLVEIRRMIEIETAGLAAKQATPEDIASLEESLRSLEQKLGSPDDFVQEDFRYHQLLAKASQNPLMPLLLEPIREQMQAFFRTASSLPGSPEAALRHHQNILNCVKQRDAEAAREAMQDHLLWAQRWGEMASKQLEEKIPKE